MKQHDEPAESEHLFFRVWESGGHVAAGPLRRSRANRMIAGVCGGIADFLGLDPTLVRVLYVLLSIIPGTIVGGIIVYVVLWIVIPEREYI